MFSDDPRVHRAVERLMLCDLCANPYRQPEKAPREPLTVADVICAIRQRFGHLAALGLRLSVH